MDDFLFALIELFRCLLRFRSYEAKCVQLGCFHKGSTSLHSNFSWTGSSLINHSWQQKTRETLGYPMVKPHPSAFSRFDSIPECDGRTDRQTDGRICRSIYSACKASFAARCKNCSNLNYYLRNMWWTLCIVKLPLFYYFLFIFCLPLLVNKLVSNFIDPQSNRWWCFYLVFYCLSYICRF